jgi:hypothetical protein
MLLAAGTNAPILRAVMALLASHFSPHSPDDAFNWSAFAAIQL